MSRPIPGRPGRMPSAALASAALGQGVIDEPGVYTIRPGDTLGSIANEFGIDLDALVADNGAVLAAAQAAECAADRSIPRCGPDSGRWTPCCPDTPTITAFNFNTNLIFAGTQLRIRGAGPIDAPPSTPNDRIATPGTGTEPFFTPARLALTGVAVAVGVFLLASAGGDRR